MKRRNPLHYNLAHFYSKDSLSRELARYKKLGLVGDEHKFLPSFNMIVHLCLQLRGAASTMYPSKGHSIEDFQKELANISDEVLFYWCLGEAYRNRGTNRPIQVALQNYFTKTTKALCAVNGLDYNSFVLDRESYPELRKILLYRKEFVDKLIEAVNSADRTELIPIALVIPYGLYSLTGSQLTPFMMLHDLFEVANSTYEIEVLRVKGQSLRKTIESYYFWQERKPSENYSLGDRLERTSVKLYAYPQIASVLSQMRSILTDKEGKWIVVPRTKHLLRWIKEAQYFDDLDYGNMTSYTLGSPVQKTKAFLGAYLQSPISNIDVLSELCALWCIKQSWEPKHFIVVSETFLKDRFLEASHQPVNVPTLIKELNPHMIKLMKEIIKAGVITIHPMSDLNREREAIKPKKPFDFRKDEIPQEVIDALS